MKCLECRQELQCLDNAHLIACSGLTVQEYALRHHLPLDVLLHPDQIGLSDSPGAYPPAVDKPGRRARTTLEGLMLAGLLREEGEFAVVPGDVRRLNLLLWDLQWLGEYGFQFRQEFRYGDSHRVVARNCLKAPRSQLPEAHRFTLPRAHARDLLDALAVFVGHVAELHNGYLFLPFAARRAGELIQGELRAQHGIRTKALEDAEAGLLLRAQTPEDSQRLLALLGERLEEMPEVRSRFQREGPRATVIKEVVFDAAHFITDHPAKCSNLHGGRYRLEVKVSDRIDPVSGCVVDYGYLKRVVTRRVVDRFDHHTLNYAAPELAWRSSTELLCIYIWEQLIDYLPGLSELQLYETPQSSCRYTGPALDQLQAQGGNALTGYFREAAAAASPLRRLLGARPAARLRVS